MPDAALSSAQKRKLGKQRKTEKIVNEGASAKGYVEQPNAK